MNENLTGICQYVWILLKQRTPIPLVGSKPWILLVNLPIKDNTSEDAKDEFYGNPQIQVFVIVGKINLEQNLYQVSRLSVNCNKIILLIRT